MDTLHCFCSAETDFKINSHPADSLVAVDLARVRPRDARAHAIVPVILDTLTAHIVLAQCRRNLKLLDARTRGW